VNKAELLDYLEKIDGELKSPAILHIYGSAAFMLLDEPDRTSLDIDVAAPYSDVDESDLRRAAELAGIPLNPADDYSSDHLEWISAVRLCLAKPNAGTDILLWRGRNLSVKTGSVPQLIASKLIRYDEIDRSDIQYLCRQIPVRIDAVEAAVGDLPEPFREDALVRENLANFKIDAGLWALRP
jgi:hypothetical protein